MEFDREITATVYIVNNGRVLLHMHKKYNAWFAVGGHVKHDELPQTAAVREAAEETGLIVELVSTEHAAVELGNVEQLALPFIICREGIGSDREFFDFVYIAKTDATRLSPQDGESRVFRWFSKSELLNEPTLKQHIRRTAIAVLDFLKAVEN